ncbi:MAG: DJ-1/PfpI family protein [Clostridia bacterium]|nr:DJ-1/PfpI family protein [Clostridia bacterium]
MLYAFLAKGFEEVEAIAAIDVIRRAEIEIYTVGIGSKIVSGSHNIPVFCDLDESEAKIDDSVDGILLPGGMPGTLNLENNETVNKFIDYCVENNKLVCAICAAPSILGHKGILEGKKAVCFPGFESELKGAELSSEFVAVDGNIITAKGMGSAVDFGLNIVEYFKGKEKTAALRASLQCPR